MKRGNQATDASGVVHTITWDGAANWGERTKNLTATCSCGWHSDSGSEASGRRQFTHHIATRLVVDKAADTETGIDQ